MAFASLDSLSFLYSDISAGSKEKKATSEAETNPERTSKTRIARILYSPVELSKSTLRPLNSNKKLKNVM